MITFSSCVIWQIISFILPTNEYGCVYAWTMLEDRPAIDLQKMSFLAKKIIYSDEAHFEVGEYINKQNSRIWGVENPHAYIEKPTHPKRVTLWCGFGYGGIIRIFCYRAMLNEFLFTKVEEKDTGNIWFLQPKL